MDLSELFHPEDFLLDFAPADKWEAIDRLFDHAVQRGLIPEEHESDIRDAVRRREESMSTGMERGIAIPHAAVDGLERVLACLGVIGPEEGLPFESIDAQPARLIVLLLIPRAQKLLHIRTLADVARVLGRESVREALLAARTPVEAHRALCPGEGAHPS